MIERYLYNALKAGLDMFSSRPSMFDALFSQLYGLGPKEVAAIRASFAKRPPKILHDFSPESAVVPCYVIDVNTESQAQTMLANSAGAVPDLGGGTPAPVFTNFWRHQYGIKCIAQQKDSAEYLYEMAKCSLCLQLLYLVKNNLDQIQMSGSQVQEIYSPPDRVFMRELSFSCIREFRFYAPENEPRLFSVDGLFVSDDRPNGGVDARITLTTPKETKNV